MLERYSCLFTNTRAGILFINEFETFVTRLYKGDELLIIINEITHEFNMYYRDNHFPAGFRGREEKLRRDDLYLKFKEKNLKEEFKNIISMQSDLLNECFTYLFLTGQSGLVKLTQPIPIPVGFDASSVNRLNIMNDGTYIEKHHDLTKRYNKKNQRVNTEEEHENAWLYKA